MSCPICKKHTSPTFRPFCSQRCAQIDLGKWFKGDYRVPSFKQDDTESLHNTDKNTSDIQNMNKEG